MLKPTDWKLERLIALRDIAIPFVQEKEKHGLLSPCDPQPPQYRQDTTCVNRGLWYELLYKEKDRLIRRVADFCQVGFEDATGIRLKRGETCYIERVKVTYRS